MLALVLIVMSAMTISFVCSFVEAALLSLTPANVATLSGEDPEIGRIWQGFKDNIGVPLALILRFNTAAHTIGAAMAGARYIELFGDKYLWAFSLVFTFFMLQYTEILPKTLGVRHRMRIGRRWALPVFWTVKILAPIFSITQFTTRMFEGGKAKGREESDTIDEIASLASMARMTRLIGPRQEKIIASATRLAKITARQVMIPMHQVLFLSTKHSVRDAFLQAHKEPHTRFPVEDGDHPGRIVGYINFKEIVYFMSANRNAPGLSGIIRPISVVSPETNGSELLKLFVDQHNHMVMVRDGDGEYLGMVTLMDVLEVLVGRIEDDYDRLPQFLHALAGGVWMAGGGTSLKELSTRLGYEFPGECQTLHDWFAHETGAEVKSGDAIVRGHFEFAVRRSKRGRVFEAVITDTRVAE